MGVERKCYILGRRPIKHLEVPGFFFVQSSVLDDPGVLADRGYRA